MGGDEPVKILSVSLNASRKVKAYGKLLCFGAGLEMAGKDIVVPVEINGLGENAKAEDGLSQRETG